MEDDSGALGVTTGVGDAAGLPRVSCILPTFNRRGFLPHALHYFQRQDYPNLDLLVVDDGTDPIADLLPADSRIRYLRLPEKVTLGAKLNIGCEQTTGSIIALWDDDDWYAPWRLSHQVAALLRTGADICGINDLLYYDLRAGCGYRYVYPPEQRLWLAGSSLCFRRQRWQSTAFVDVNVGMDAEFVWAAPPRTLCRLDARLAVHLMHRENVSPKDPKNAWWRDYPVTEIERTMGGDFRFYEGRGEVLTCPRPRSAARVAPGEAAEARPDKTVRNVYLCLVHESRECVRDLVENLAHVDPDSTILLYNGGHDPGLLSELPQGLHDVVIYPQPRPMRWGVLHPFALDCMRFARDAFHYDTLTIVDSDQLALRPGWPKRLAAHLAGRSNIGLLGNVPQRQTASTAFAPASTAWQEHALWQPFLNRFSQGESKFVHWSFWPSTVFMEAAARELVHLFDHDRELNDILRRSRLWATEEVLFPTLTALLGFDLVASPESYEFVRYRVDYSPEQIQTALARSDAFWIHPIARRHDDPLRRAVREQLGHYSRRSPPPPPCVGPNAHGALGEAERKAILRQMAETDGWLSQAEAELLMDVTREALTRSPDGTALVEVGCYRGKATVVIAGVVRALRPSSRVTAIDPHDGVVGAADRGLLRYPPTFSPFLDTIARAGLTSQVEPVRARAHEVPWSRVIGFLVIDGLHDYENVARDFRHFERCLAPNGLAAFHDYADYFPGVRAFVDELLATGGYAVLARCDSMIVLCRSD